MDSEIQVKEAIHDAKFLASYKFFAVAQETGVFLYGNRGTMIHSLKNVRKALKLEFLPHHMLLASVARGGLLRYHDISTGAMIAQLKTHSDPCNVMCQNRWNGVICLGHHDGRVTMWTPNAKKPAAEMFCQRGKVQTMAVDFGGHYLITTGLDSQIKLWDLRNLQQMQQYFSKSIVISMDISQKGFLALGYGHRVEIWKEIFTGKHKSPYLNHVLERNELCRLAFCPYDDTLLLSHSKGVSTIQIPGAGEPDFGSAIINPCPKHDRYKKTKVSGILDKLLPESIMLNPEDFCRTL